MIRNNLAIKIGLSMMVLIFAVALAQYVSLGQLLKNAFYQESGTQLLTQGQQYANMSSMGGTMMMRMLCATSNVEMVIVNRSGKVISASPSILIKKPNVSDRSVIAKALAGQNGLQDGNSQLFGKSGIIAAIPVRQANRVTGAVVLFRSGDMVDTTFHHMQWLLILVGLGGILLALGLVVILSNRIANPLQKMALVAKEMSRGNYQAKVPVTGDDEIGKLGQAMNDLAANLHHLDTTRKEFLADISHELRTPISYLIGYSQVLAEGMVQSQEEMQQYLHILHDEARRLEGLVGDLFVLAQADAGMMTIDKKPIALDEVMVAVVERMQKRAEDKKVILRVQVPPLPKVNADPARMEQVLYNLIDNAIRYTESDGQVQVSARVFDKHVEVVVSDTGIGIAQSDLPHIFDRLYRADKSRSRAGGGTGLGLAIVRHIIEAHGGHISVTSTVNVGTTFTFIIAVASS